MPCWDRSSGRSSPTSGDSGAHPPEHLFGVFVAGPARGAPRPAAGGGAAGSVRRARARPCRARRLRPVPAGSAAAPPPGPARPSSDAGGASGKEYLRKGKTPHGSEG